MSAPSVLSVEQLDHVRELLRLGKQVNYIAQRLNIPRTHIIESGFGDGLRYDPKADVMTARPAALDHDPEPRPERSELTGFVRAPKPREAAVTPAHLLPPKPPVVVPADEPAPQEEEQDMHVAYETEPSVAELMRQHGTTTAEVRKWAQEHGVFCPSHGSVPRDVFMQWLAAPVLESGTDRPDEQDTAADIVLDNPGPEIANPQVSASEPAAKQDTVHRPSTVDEPRDCDIEPRKTTANVTPQWHCGDRVLLMLLGERVTGTVSIIFPDGALGVCPDRLIAGTDLVVATADELEALPAPEKAAEKSPNNIPAVVEAGDAVETAAGEPIESVDALLEQVRLTDDPQVRTAARHVWNSATVLAETLRRVVAKADLEAAKQRLDEATAAAEAARMEYLRLAALTGANNPAGHAALGALAAADVRAQLAEHGTDSAAVRVWARTAGIDCPPTGTVPRRVLQAWLDANHPNERTAQ